MIRRTTGAFRGLDSALQANFQDSVYAAGAAQSLAQYTTGVSLVDKLASIFPPTASEVELLSLSVSGRLALYYPDGRGGYGRFGKVVTGLTQTGSPTSSVDPASGTNVPWSRGAALPADMALVTSLWDPQNDPCPPQFAALPAGGFASLPVSATLTLPSPVPVFQGTDILIGMWALPSLLSCSTLGGVAPPPSAYLLMYQANYTFVYDDKS